MILFLILFILVFFGSCFSLIHKFDMPDLPKLLAELILVVITVILFVKMLEMFCK